MTALQWFTNQYEVTHLPTSLQVPSSQKVFTYLVKTFTHWNILLLLGRFAMDSKPSFTFGISSVTSVDPVITKLNSGKDFMDIAGDALVLVYSTLDLL
jgi:hypothetical protein